ncbi:MAG: disulfide bond formation protein B, partial [Alphaproteobacteria bacterium]
LMARIMSAPLVRCDEIVWSFAGISMAGWNAILSLGLALTWFAAFRAGGRDQARSSASQ